MTENLANSTAAHFAETVLLPTEQSESKKNKKQFVEAIGAANFRRLVRDLNGSARSIVKDCYDSDTACPQFEGDEPDPIPFLHLDKDKTRQCRMFVTIDKKTGERIYMESTWTFVKIVVPRAKERRKVKKERKQ